MNTWNLYDYATREKTLTAFERNELWNIQYSARRGRQSETKSHSIAKACEKCGCRVIRKGDVWKIS